MESTLAAAKAKLDSKNYEAAIPFYKRAAATAKKAGLPEWEKKCQNLIDKAMLAKDTDACDVLKGIANKSMADDWFSSAIKEYQVALDFAEQGGRLGEKYIAEIKSLQTTAVRRQDMYWEGKKKEGEAKAAEIRKKREVEAEAARVAAEAAEAKRIAGEEEAKRQAHLKWISSKEYKLEQHMLGLQQANRAFEMSDKGENIKEMKMAQAKKLFKGLDEDDIGGLDAEKLTIMCKKLGMRVGTADMELLIQEMDT